MYNYGSNPCASSTSALSSPSPQDEISLFLRQFLLPSSSSASSPSLMTHMGKNAHGSMSSTSMAGLHPSYRSSLLQDGISAVDSTLGGSTSNDVFLSSSGIYSSANTKGNSAVNVSSSSLGVCENEYHCESEEGFEALAEEHPANPRRTSSKRGRAAEVHNLSEKRRRSRINEKMKALQNLIPNSNKTDKASMLDEAIEYLKQLQLQVQMLSMRNGLSLHHMCLAEDMQTLQLSQMGTELDEENSYLPSNMTATLPLHQENPLPYVSTLPNEHTSRDQPSVPSPSYVVKPETSFGQESPMIAHLRPFHLKRTSEIRRDDDILQHQQLNANHSDTNPSGGSQVSLFFDMQTSEPKDNSSLETCIAGRDQLGVILRNSEHDVILTSQLSS